MSDIDRFNSYLPLKLKLEAGDKDYISKLNEFALAINEINPLHMQIKES